jgi:hypothetical protein
VPAQIEILEDKTLLSAGTFFELPKLAASDAAVGDQFGSSVAPAVLGYIREQGLYRANSAPAGS